jgi:hypothetical protein
VNSGINISSNIFSPPEDIKVLRRRVFQVLAFASILSAAAACTDMTTAPADDPTHVGVSCLQPAPESGMICRGEVWSWG